MDSIAEYDGSNVLQRRFVFGPGIDEPIVRYDGSGTSNRSFMGADERGSVISLTDSSGTLLNINRYDEYGKPQSTNAGRFQYTGQRWLGEAGLYDYKARNYVPHLGIFGQSDPIRYAGGLNLYSYVRNDPANLIDPMGLCEGGTKGPEAACAPCPGVRIVTEWGSECLTTNLGLNLPRKYFGWLSLDWFPGMREGREGRQGGESLVEKIAHNIQCRIKSFDVGFDFAGGFGPVARGGVGLSYDRNTGRVSWRYNWGVGYGAAFSGGLSGSASNSLPSTGYSESWNFGANFGGGGSAEFQTPNDVSVSAGFGPQVGFEVSKTENYGNSGYIYTADPSQCRSDQQ